MDIMPVSFVIKFIVFCTNGLAWQHDHFANWRMPTINWPTSPGQGESIFSSIITTVVGCFFL